MLNDLIEYAFTIPQMLMLVSSVLTLIFGVVLGVYLFVSCIKEEIQKYMKKHKEKRNA